MLTTCAKLTNVASDANTYDNFASDTDIISINTLTIAEPNNPTIRVFSRGIAIQNSDIDFI